MQRDVMLGSLKLNLTATRHGVTISYYAQDHMHHTGMGKVRLGTLSADELRNGGTEASVDITAILPDARDLFLKAGGKLEPDAA